MKANISVPDELWDAAVNTSTVGTSPSAIVQDALKRAISAGSAQRELDSDTEQLRNSVRQIFAGDVSRSWNRGYQMGLKLAEAAGSRWQIYRIANRGLARWIDDLDVRVHDYLKSAWIPNNLNDQLGVRWIYDQDGDEEIETYQFIHDQKVALDTEEPPLDLWLSAVTLIRDEEILTVDLTTIDPILMRGTEAALRDVLALDDDAAKS